MFVIFVYAWLSFSAASFLQNSKTDNLEKWCALHLVDDATTKKRSGTRLKQEDILLRI